MAGVTDNFTNTNGTALDTHDANWTVAIGSISPAEIQSNRLQVNSFSDRYYYYDGSAEDYAQVTLVGGTFQRDCGPAIRLASGSRGYRLTFEVGTDPDYTRIAIYRENTRVAFLNISALDSSNDIELRLVGTINGSDLDLEGFIDDVSTITYTDTTPLAAGNDGIAMSNGVGGISLFDDFTSESVVAPSLTGPLTQAGDDATLSITGTALSTDVNDDVVVNVRDAGGTLLFSRTLPTTNRTATSVEVDFNAGFEDAYGDASQSYDAIPFTLANRKVEWTYVGDDDTPLTLVFTHNPKTGAAVNEFTKQEYIAGNSMIEKAMDYLDTNDFPAQQYFESPVTGGSPASVVLDLANAIHPLPNFLGGDTDTWDITYHKMVVFCSDNKVRQFRFDVSDAP